MPCRRLVPELALPCAQTPRATSRCAHAHAGPHWARCARAARPRGPPGCAHQTPRWLQKPQVLNDSVPGRVSLCAGGYLRPAAPRQGRRDPGPRNRRRRRWVYVCKSRVETHHPCGRPRTPGGALPTRCRVYAPGGGVERARQRVCGGGRKDFFQATKLPAARRARRAPRVSAPHPRPLTPACPPPRCASCTSCWRRSTSRRCPPQCAT